MKKKFKKMKDHLQVVVTGDQPINLPVDGKTVQIGVLKNKQTQKIDLDKVDVLIKYLEEQKESGQGQVDAITMQLKGLENVDPDAIDSEVVSACKDKLSNGTNGFKSKMTALNKLIDNMDKKRNLLAQKEYLESQVNPLLTELADIKKAMK